MPLATTDIAVVAMSFGRAGSKQKHRSLWGRNVIKRALYDFLFARVFLGVLCHPFRRLSRRL
jgi:hypothetical protein